MSEEATQITLSTLKAELGALELRIVDRLSASLDAKADKVHLEQLEARVNSLELSRASREQLPQTLVEQEHTIGDMGLRIQKLERFRYSVPSAAVIMAVANVALVVWYFSHGG